MSLWRILWPFWPLVPRVERDPEAEATPGTRNRPVRWWRCGLAVALALLAWGALRAGARRPELVERHYSGSVFPWLRDRLASVSGLLPFSLAELFLGLGALWLLWLVLETRILLLEKRRTPGNLFRRALTRGTTFACALYVAFLVTWGFNHARRPYADHAGLEVAPVSREELVELGEWLVAECNRLRGEVRDDELVLEEGPRGADPRLLLGFEALAGEVPALRGGAPVVRRPQLSPLLSWCGISGIYSPFTAEAHCNAEIVDWLRPFTACHEVAHWKGFAREDEASFIAWQACRASGDIAFAYSASCAALAEVLAALSIADAEAARALAGELTGAVRRDYQRNRVFWERHRGLLRHLARASNDAYLRSQGQEEGLASYGRMVDLLVAERR